MVINGPFAGAVGKTTFHFLTCSVIITTETGKGTVTTILMEEN